LYTVTICWNLIYLDILSSALFKFEKVYCSLYLFNRFKFVSLENIYNFTTVIWYWL